MYSLSNFDTFVSFVSENSPEAVKLNWHKNYIVNELYILMAWEVSDMIHRIHYRNLNNYLAFYYQEIHRRTYHKPKKIHREKIDTVEIIKIKTKILGAMA
jgi:hypothetical protein